MDFFSETQELNAMLNVIQPGVESYNLREILQDLKGNLNITDHEYKWARNKILNAIKAKPKSQPSPL